MKNPKVLARLIISKHPEATMRCTEYHPKNNRELYDIMVEECAFILTEGGIRMNRAQKSSWTASSRPWSITTSATSWRTCSGSSLNLCSKNNSIARHRASAGCLVLPYGIHRSKRVKHPNWRYPHDYQDHKQPRPSSHHQ